jgi:DNA-binding NarL/FixJ family response regulator
MTIRVLIAADQEMMRSAFRMILDSQPDMSVVASVGDGEAAVEQARGLRPDVCLLDIRMPNWTVWRRPGCWRARTSASHSMS